MRPLTIALPCLALLAASCASAAPRSINDPPSSQATAVADGSLIITGVSIIDPVRGSTSAPQDIVIEAGRIAATAPAGTLTAPAGTPRLDGTGRFAMAGLIDVHAHVGEGGIAPGDDATRARALRQFLRYGVTTLFVPGATGAGDADFPALRERCRSVVASCPGLYGSGSLITAPGSHPVSTIFNMPADTPAEVTEARGVTVLRPGMDIDALIAAKQAAGVDAIKIVIEDGPPPWYPKPRLADAQIRALVEAAHARSLPVFAHISTSDQVRIALDAGVDGIMHGPTDRLPDELVRRMAEQRMTFVATFALYDGILTWARGQRESDPYALAGVEPSAIESLTAPPFLAAAATDEAEALGYLANVSDNLRRAAAAGVPIALGTDVNNPFVFPGYSAHEELSWMVRAGLTPAQALQAGTVGGAAFLRRPEQVGRLAPGYEADVVLLARNPLERIENSRSIVAVFADGERVAEVVSAE
ncbi:MAG: amidohydrolase family protein [Caulobacterales bacterium]|nr:amidohydrolase family protein [Caulobacterales bacterium]